MNMDSTQCQIFQTSSHLPSKKKRGGVFLRVEKEIQYENTQQYFVCSTISAVLFVVLELLIDGGNNIMRMICLSTIVKRNRLR